MKHAVEIADLYVEFEESNAVITKISTRTKSGRPLTGVDLRKIRTPILLRLITPSKKPKKATPKQWRLQFAVDMIRENPYESPTKVVSKALCITPQSARNLLTRARRAGILID